MEYYKIKMEYYIIKKVCPGTGSAETFHVNADNVDEAESKAKEKYSKDSEIESIEEDVFTR